jgi:hypothetical protein
LIKDTKESTREAVGVFCANNAAGEGPEEGDVGSRL